MFVSQISMISRVIRGFNEGAVLPYRRARRIDIMTVDATDTPSIWTISVR